jgi:hypothetical protein
LNFFKYKKEKIPAPRRCAPLTACRAKHARRRWRSAVCAAAPWAVAKLPSREGSSCSSRTGEKQEKNERENRNFNFKLFHQMRRIKIKFPP